jgi:ABC-2 type transport system permease protein
MKLVAGVLIMLIVYIVTALATYGSIAMVNNGSVPMRDLVPFSLALLLIQVLFYSFGTFFAAILVHPKKATMFVSIVVFLCYIAYVLQGLSDQFSWFKQVTPFGFFNARDILADTHLNLGYVAITASFSVILLIATYIGYTRRDFKI